MAAGDKTPAGSELLSAHRQDGIIPVSNEWFADRRDRFSFPGEQRAARGRVMGATTNCISGPKLQRLAPR